MTAHPVRRRGARVTPGATLGGDPPRCRRLVARGRDQWFFNDDWGQWAAPTASRPPIDDPGTFFFGPAQRPLDEPQPRGVRRHLPRRRAAELLPVPRAGDRGARRRGVAAVRARAAAPACGSGSRRAPVPWCSLWFGSGAEVLIVGRRVRLRRTAGRSSAHRSCCSSTTTDRSTGATASGRAAVLGMMAGRPSITMIAVVALQPA